MNSFWGPLFPQSFWGPLWPELPPIIALYAWGPPGAAVLALSLEADVSVKWRWSTHVFKAMDGKEQRASNRQLPAQTYQGGAFLAGTNAAATRATLGRYAASGVSVMLGLPYEEATILWSNGNTAVVTGTAALDWCAFGQRVLLTDRDGAPPSRAIIQGFTSNTITFDVPVGGNAAKVMPGMVVYLDPAQSFTRWITPATLELWTIAATAAVAGFAGSQPLPASLPLAAPLTTSGTLTSMVLVSKETAPSRTGFTVSFQAASLGFGVSVQLVETPYVSTLVRFRNDGTTSVGSLLSALASSVNVRATGTWSKSAHLVPVADEFAPTGMQGISAGTPGAMGLGATVAAHAGRPVFDRGINVHDLSAADSMMAMNQLIDLGATMASVGEGSSSDWGRQLSMYSRDIAEYQWAKAFFSTVRGRFKSFWLPTWRADLIPA